MVHDHLSKAGAQRAAATLLLGQEVANLDTEAGAFEGCHSCFRRVGVARELIQEGLLDQNDLSKARKRRILRGIQIGAGHGGKHGVPRNIRDYLDLVT